MLDFIEPCSLDPCLKWPLIKFPYFADTTERGGFLFIYLFIYLGPPGLLNTEQQTIQWRVRVTEMKSSYKEPQINTQKPSNWKPFTKRKTFHIPNRSLLTWMINPQVMDDLIQYGHHTLHQLTLTPKKREKSLVTNMTSFCLLPLLQRRGQKRDTKHPPFELCGCQCGTTQC